MKLYYMPGACSLATHILMRESGQTVELDKVGRDKKTESGANFLEINPKGYVPALQLDDGEVLTENVVVHNYLADLKPGSKLAPPHGTKARLRQDELALYISTEIHKTYGAMFNPVMSDEMKQASRDRLAVRYELIEKLLADGRPYLTGENFATVDAYLFTVTRWAPGLKVDLSKFPKVMAYQERVAARPAVKAALEAEGLLKAA
ncbi:MAG: glutathione transferase GstA [Hyphomonadaceae bacterium]|nr:glutathione transferase GstA [Hyphomonadaceae bacterium]